MYRKAIILGLGTQHIEYQMKKKYNAIEVQTLSFNSGV